MKVKDEERYIFEPLLGGMQITSYSSYKDKTSHLPLGRNGEVIV